MDFELHGVNGMAGTEVISVRDQLIVFGMVKLAGLFCVLTILTGCPAQGGGMLNQQFPEDQYFDEPMVSFLNAVKRKDRHRAQSILDQGLDLNINGREGITPLLWIIMQWDLQTMELMLQLGADSNFSVKHTTR